MLIATPESDKNSAMHRMELVFDVHIHDKDDAIPYLSQGYFSVPINSSLASSFDETVTSNYELYFGTPRNMLTAAMTRTARKPTKHSFSIEINK